MDFEKPEWYKEFIKEYKEKTGFDFENHTQDEWNEHWISRLKAENDPYKMEIFDMVQRIIENKEYSHLYKIMKDYDELVKKGLHTIKWADGGNHPFWCISFCYDTTQYKKDT